MHLQAANSTNATMKFKGVVDSTKQIKEKLIGKSMTVSNIIKKADNKHKIFTQIANKTEGNEDSPHNQKAPKPGHKNNLSLNTNNKFIRNNTTKNVTKKKLNNRSDINLLNPDKSNETVKQSQKKTTILESKSEKKVLNNFQTHSKIIK